MEEVARLFEVDHTSSIYNGNNERYSSAKRSVSNGEIWQLIFAAVSLNCVASCGVECFYNEAQYFVKHVVTAAISYLKHHLQVLKKFSFHESLFLIVALRWSHGSRFIAQFVIA